MKKLGAMDFKKGIQKAYETLAAHQSEVNALNVFPVPDGDTGTNMTLTMRSAWEAVEAAPESVTAITKALGTGSLMGARGNSGVILSQLCRGIAQALKGKDEVALEDVPAIFESARAKAYKAVMQPTEGTILTIARAMSEFASERRNDYTEILPFLKDILRHANATLQKTPDMLPALKEAGVVDSGGQGLVYLVYGFLQSFTEEDLSDLLTVTATAKTEEPELAELSAEEQAKAFFVSFSVTGIDEDRMLRHLANHGLLHAHAPETDGFYVEALSDEPIRLLASQAKRGNVVRARILPVEEYLRRPDTAEEAVEEAKEAEPLRPYGFVSVSMGEGFEMLFRDLMVDEVVAGGQTMNPSTRDLYEAVQKVPAECVFILPNNKNIIMAAEQVSELTDKTVHVIPTRSMPEGITALFHFNETLSPEENLSAMTESLSQVLTGSITYAVRDTEISGLQIHKDDQIGLVCGQIIACRPDSPELLFEEMLDKILRPEHTLLTIYVGSEVEESAVASLEKALHAKAPSLEVETTSGGQPIYSYIFSLE